MKNMEEKTSLSEIIFQGKILDVRRDNVILPNGKAGVREWINHPGAVCCIPILPDGKIALIKQYRYAVREVMIELPAGKLEKGENPEKCAHRELEEETGFSAKKLTFLINIHPAVGFANEKMWIFIAEDLLQTKTNLDSDEFIELIPTSLDDALNLIWTGKITDVKTIIGLLIFHRTINRF